MWKSCAVAAVLSSALLATARGGDIYVDNRNGNDANDGTAPTVRTILTGPVKTIARALQRIQPGDALVLTRNEEPYFESLVLAGGKYRGASTVPFVVRGNGATLCGLRRLPADGWRPAGEGLWQLNFTRKGWGRLFRNGVPYPEQVSASGQDPLTALADGSWWQQRGVVYVRHEKRSVPTEHEWTYAAVDFGVSLVDGRFVEITDLNVLGFRIDGVNVDNASRSVVLKNVSSSQNGRAGLAVGGSSRVTLEACRFADNGRYSLLVTEAAGVGHDDTDFGAIEPVDDTLKY